MKKIPMLIFSIFMLLTVISPVNAKNVAVEDDIYIAPLKNINSQSEQAIDQHLEKMGFNNDEISSISSDLKKDIASRGGVKWASKKLNPTETFYDETGKAIIVTDENRDAIDQKISDYTGQGNASTLKYTSSDFELWGWVIKYGSYNATQNEYAVYGEYKWINGPVNAYTDSIAVAWESKVTPLSTQAGLHYWRPPGSVHSFTNVIHQQQIQGTGWKVDVISGGSPQDGWGRRNILVAKTETGNVGAVAVGYAHRLAPGGVGLSFTWGVISYTSALQTTYSDLFNFTY